MLGGLVAWWCISLMSLSYLCFVWPLSLLCVVRYPFTSLSFVFFRHHLSRTYVVFSSSLCRRVERWMWLCVFFLGEVSSDLVSPQVKEKEKVRRKEKYHSHVSTKAHTHTHTLSSPCLHTYTSIYVLSAPYVTVMSVPPPFYRYMPLPFISFFLSMPLWWLHLTSILVSVIWKIYSAFLCHRMKARIETRGQSD